MAFLFGGVKEQLGGKDVFGKLKDWADLRSYT
jgi:hypothetical protein